LATTHGLKSLTFPSIRTGVDRFPKDAAARIAVKTMRRALAASNAASAAFVCFSDEDLDIDAESLKS
jgi:O-acetyl-ADP-ribose deacetylase (regulator of RNase III)